MFKLLATIFVLSCCQPVLGQLTARFTADITGGCGPLVVHFSNQTTGAGVAASYQWDLGNGNSAVVADPVATYTQPGSYIGGSDGSGSVADLQLSAKSLRFIAADRVIYRG